jgi:hypothetical protein
MIHHAVLFADVVKTLSVTLEYGVRSQGPRDYFNLNDTCKYHAHGSEKLCYRKRPAFRFDFTMLLQRVYVRHLGAGIFCNTGRVSDSYFFDWTRFDAMLL